MKKIEAGSDIILWDSSGYEESLNWNFKWIDKISTNKEKILLYILELKSEPLDEVNGAKT